MNVLYLINYAGKAGTEKYVENLIRILGEKKINPHFAYCIPGELSEKMKNAGIPCLQLEMGKLSVAKASKVLADYCRENNIDVIHAQYPRENIVALLSKRHYSKPRVIMTNHLMLELSGISGIIWRFLNKRFTPKNHCIITVCNKSAELLRENSVDPDKIKIIFNGVEPSSQRVRDLEKRKELDIPEDAFVMTIFSRFSPEKGLDFLVDVLDSLKSKTDKPFYCLICGDGELFQNIQSRINKLNLSNQCKLLGFRKDTDELLKCSDIYLNTSSCEAMSFAILEAMNAGLPLVLTDVGGNRELASDFIQCGYISPYGDAETFADNILKLMNDSDLRDRFSENAIEKVSKYFDLNKLAEDVYNTYL